MQRLVWAVDSGDYPVALSLWDAFVLKNPVNTDFKVLLHIETLLNLFLATYPFREDVVRIARFPEVAGNVASRSMAIFENYVESRKVLMKKYNISIFFKYCNITKISFPPTHPQYRLLFEESWMEEAKAQIIEFLYSRLGSKTLHDSVISLNNSFNLNGLDQCVPGALTDGVQLVPINAYFPPA